MLNRFTRLDSRGIKSTMFYERGTSKGRLEIKDKPRFRNRVSDHVPSNLLKSKKDRVSNPKSQNV